MGIIYRIAPPGRLVGDLVQSCGTIGAAAIALASLVGRWQDRSRQRHTLSQLDARLLRDIGLTRADVDAECRKRPWQP